MWSFLNFVSLNGPDPIKGALFANVFLHEHFFFQAEDGIRDVAVTGVQTCALPISEAMELIARTAQGSMRDAVGLLDQLVPLASGPIAREGARSLLGIADPRVLDALLDHVLGGNAAEALTELNRIYSAGGELRQVVRGLMEGCRDRLLAALTKRDQMTARRLSGVLDALVHLDGEVRRHAEPGFLFEGSLVALALERETDHPEVTASVAPVGVSSPVVAGS